MRIVCPSMRGQFSTLAENLPTEWEKFPTYKGNGYLKVETVSSVPVYSTFLHLIPYERRIEFWYIAGKDDSLGRSANFQPAQQKILSLSRYYARGYRAGGESLSPLIGTVSWEKNGEHIFRK